MEVVEDIQEIVRPILFLHVVPHLGLCLLTVLVLAFALLLAFTLLLALALFIFRVPLAGDFLLALRWLGLLCGLLGCFIGCLIGGLVALFIGLRIGHV